MAKQGPLALDSNSLFMVSIRIGALESLIADEVYFNFIWLVLSLLPS